MPEVTWIDVKPVLDPHEARSCVAVCPEKVAALEPEPWSVPANDPVTLAVPPASGKVNPSSPETPEAPPYPENVRTVGRTVEGVQLMSMVRAREVSSPAQELVELVIVADPVPFVTRETLEPFVVHPAAVSVIAVDSGLVPFVVSAGENANAPEMVRHVTDPVAIRAAVVVAVAPDPELHAAPRNATRTSGARPGNPNLRVMDMVAPP